MPRCAVFDRVQLTNQCDPTVPGEARERPTGVHEPVGSNLHPRRQLKMPHNQSFARHARILRVGLCPSRLKAIRPSLAKRGTALRASHEAVLRGQTSGFDEPPGPHKYDETIIFEGGIVTGSPYGDPVIPRLLAEGPPYGRPTKQCFVVEPVGSNLHPRRQLKMPHKAAFSIGGEGGIRTHVTDFVRPSDFESAPLWPLRYLSELQSLSILQALRIMIF